MIAALAAVALLLAALVVLTLAGAARLNPRPSEVDQLLLDVMEARGKRALSERVGA